MKILLTVGLGVVGSLVLPGLGIGLGAVSGFLAGASIGNTLGSILTAPKKPREDPKFSKTYAFQAGGTLTPLGGPVPEIYCNRNVNPNGGFRTTGYLIASMIRTVAGVQSAHLLYTLGKGELGEVSYPDTLINSQTLDTFYAEDVYSVFRKGGTALEPNDDFPYFSQVVSPSTNQLCGIDLRGEVKSSTSFEEGQQVTFTNLRNSYALGNTLVKSAGGVGWNSGASSVERLTYEQPYGFVEITVDVTTSGKSFGLSSDDPDADIATIRFGIALRASGIYDVYENGTIVFTSSSSYIVGQVFRVEILSNGNIAYKLNGATFYTTIAPSLPYPFFFDSSINTNNARITNARFGVTGTKNSGSINPAGTATNVITVDEEDFETYIPSENYSIRNTNYTVQPFRVISKNYDDLELTLNTPVTLGSGNNVYATWKASYETTKRVSQIEVNLNVKLWARNELGELVYHAAVFDLYLKKVGSTGFSLQQRFIVTSNNPNGVHRSFKIKNLPLGKYHFELRPKIGIASSELPDIRKISNTADRLQTFNTATSYAGQTVQVEYEYAETLSNSEANDKLSYDEKVQVSTDDGPAISISSVNEIVEPEALPQSLGLSPNVGLYPGYATVGYHFTQTQPSDISTLVTQGRVIPQLLKAGIASSGSGGTTMKDAFNSFGDLPGQCFVRNLTTHDSGAVSTSSGTSIGSPSVLWHVGDEYLIYSLGASNYFPDIYAHKLISSHSRWTQAQSDRFIDYASFVTARDFCVDNNYFWDGVIEAEETVASWADRESKTALLFTPRIDGRFALLPERATPVTAIFNAYNVKQFSEAYVSLGNQTVNTVIVSYRDGTRSEDGTPRFGSKTVLIRSLEASRGEVDPVEESLDLPAVTNMEQAIDVGVVFFNSRTRQDKTISITTDMECMDLMPGDLFIAQIANAQAEEELSSIVSSVSGSLIGLLDPVEFGMGSEHRLSIEYASGGVDVALNFSISPTGLLQLDNNTKQPSIGDRVTISRSTLTSHKYRAAKILVGQEARTVTVDGVLWVDGLYDRSNLSILTP